jgi:hypothetical protein
MPDQSEKPKEAPKEAPKPRMTESMLAAQRKKDSFNVPVQKSPWAVYAMLQVPIVIIMAILVYVLWSQSKG